MKYGIEERGWFSNLCRGSYDVSLWMIIRKEVTQLQQYCSLLVGNNCKIRFWEDLWIGYEPLCLSFPSMFKMVGSKGMSAVELWDPLKGNWNYKFERILND